MTDTNEFRAIPANYPDECRHGHENRQGSRYVHVSFYTPDGYAGCISGYIKPEHFATICGQLGVAMEPDSATDPSAVEVPF